MARLSSHGGFDPELLAKVKEELSGNLEFSEQQEPLDRNKAGMPSTKGFIETHFNLGEHSSPFDFSTCQRPDGSYYGTGGTCRKGTEVKGGVSKKEKAIASMRAKDLKARGASGENHGKQVKSAAATAAAAEKAEKKAEKKLSKEAGNGDVDGMYVKGGARINPNKLMQNVGKQLEKEYGVKMDQYEANGEKSAPGTIDGFVTTKNGKSFEVSMENAGDGEWIVDSFFEQ